jgi:hypothetical protein
VVCKLIAPQGGFVPPLDLVYRKDWYEEQIKKYERGRYKFYPISTREAAVSCSIDILFLRPDAPGAILRSGDIDNRLKTIFDALRMPRDNSELGGYGAPDFDEEPFFCLLEDDSLINRVAIETDTVLQPTGAAWDVNDARLVVAVRLWPYRATYGNIGFSG